MSINVRMYVFMWCWRDKQTKGCRFLYESIYLTTIGDSNYITNKLKLICYQNSQFKIFHRTVCKLLQ